MASGGDAPTPPDYRGAAEATAQGNLDAIRRQTEANRVAQTTPWGTINWTNNRIFDEDGYNKALAEWNAANQKGTWVEAVPDQIISTGGDGGSDTLVRGTPGYWSGATSSGTAAPKRDDFTRDNWHQSVALNDDLQAALTAQQQIGRDRSQAAAGMSGAVTNAFSQPFNVGNLDSYIQSMGIRPVNQQVGTNALSHPDLQDFSTDFGRFSSKAEIDTNVGRATSGALGQIQNVAGFGSSATPLNQDFKSTAPTLNTSQMSFSGGPRLNTEARDFLGGVNEVNQNGPQWTQGRQDEYARAAYEAQMALMRSDLAQQDERTNNRLALQGLTPGSQASNNALAVYNDARSRQLNALANQSVLTGNEMSNRDFASQLDAFRAGNEAQNQAYTQGMGVFNANNSALDRNTQNDLSAFAANLTAQKQANDARQAEFDQQLDAFNASNAARSQQFQNDLGAYGANLDGVKTANAARNAEFANALSRFTAGNDAQLQKFGMDQTTFKTNSDTMQRENDARQVLFDALLRGGQADNDAQGQAVDQMLTRYNTDMADALMRRYMPYQEQNMLLNGSGVGMPNFPGYTQAGNAGGPDYLTSATRQGQAADAQHQADVASANATNATAAQLAGTLAMMWFSDARLKTNIRQVGRTRTSRALYVWEWAQHAPAAAKHQPPVGVLAQENMDIAIEGPDGLLRVDYSKLD